MKNKIELGLPIKITPTIDKDGYIITDANGTEHFFYLEGEESEELLYDGRCTTIKNEI